MAVLLGTVLLASCLALTEADFAVITPLDVTGTWRHSVTLPCAYFPEDHTPQRVVWLFEGRRIFERDDAGNHVLVTRYRDRLSLPQDSQGSNVSLTILNLEIEDGGVYTCKVSLRSPGTSSLTINEASTHLHVIKADFVVIAPHDVTGTWRHSVTLPCAYFPEDHTPQRVVWLFEGRRIFERDDAGNHVLVTRYRDRLSLPQDSQASNVSLTILNLEIDEGGVYTCKVSLRSPGTSSLIINEASTHLHVIKVAVTKPVVQPAGSLFEVSQGTTLKFTCFAEGSPPITYRWYKRGAEGTRDLLPTSGSSFIIERAQTSHSGGYFCEVENKIPAKTTQQSQVFQLSITDAAVSTTTNPQIGGLGSTERMTTTENSQSTREREPHSTSAPSSTKAPGASSGSTLLLIIMVVVISLALLVILVAVYIIRCKRRKGNVGIYEIPTMSELDARANQNAPIVNVCQVNINPINDFGNNSCPISDMPTPRKQNDYQPVVTSDDQKPRSDCQGPYANWENEYEQLLSER